MKDYSAFLLPLINQMPSAVFGKDLSEGHKIIFWNKEAELLFGFSRAEVIGKTDFDIFPKEQAEFFQKKDLEAFRTKSLVEIPTEKITSKNGVLILRTRKIPLFNSEGEPWILLGVTEKALPNADHAICTSTFEELAARIALQINQTQNPSTSVLNLSRAPKVEVDFNSLVRTIFGILNDRLLEERISHHFAGSKSACLIACRPVEISQLILQMIHSSLSNLQGASQRVLNTELVVTLEHIEMYVENSGTQFPELYVASELLIARQIAEAHGGTLEIGQGPRVSLCLRLPLGQ